MEMIVAKSITSTEQGTENHVIPSRICGLGAVFACLALLAACEAQDTTIGVPASQISEANPNDEANLSQVVEEPPAMSEKVLWSGTINDGDYIVFESDQIFNPVKMREHPEVDVFPLDSGWAVARTDGTAIRKADKAEARKAFQSWCKGLFFEGEFVENNGDPVWLFKDCTI